MKTQQKYVDFDKGGQITTVGCMTCGETVAVRDFKVLENGSCIPVLSHLANWAQVKVILTDGTYAEPILCKDCLREKPLDLEHIERTMKWGWTVEALQAGRPTDYMKRLGNTLKFIGIKQQIKRDK